MTGLSGLGDLYGLISCCRPSLFVNVGELSAPANRA